MIKLFLIIIFMIFISIFTVFDAIIYTVAIRNRNVERAHCKKVVNFIFDVIKKISGVRVHVTGEENLRALEEKEKSFFIISNHRGFFDAITGYTLFKKDVGIVSKDSIKKVPVFAYWMKKIDCIFLNRKDLRDGVRMVIDAINNINAGISMWIFPEGTRCRDEDQLAILEFKQGAFKIAEKTNCYILPISFRNTENAFEKCWPRVRAVDIYINIGTPYKICELPEDEQRNIAHYSQEVIRNLLAEEKI